MDKSEIEPRKNLSSPIPGLTDRAIIMPDIPEISLFSNNCFSPAQIKSSNCHNYSYQQQQKQKSRPELLLIKEQCGTITIPNNNSCRYENKKNNSNNKQENLKQLKSMPECTPDELFNKQQNGHDLRFKFYQKLKETKNIIPVSTNKILRSNVGPVYKHISENYLQNKSSSLNNNSNNNNSQINYDNLKLLLSLIKSQNQQIKSLKIQIKALLSIYEREKYNKKKVVLLNPHGNNLELTSNDPKLQETKVSIGVMTSFEFTLKKKPNELTTSKAIINLSSNNNNNNNNLNVLESKINSPEPVRVSETRLIANSNSNKNNGDDECLLIDNNNSKPMAKSSSKVGWTFYNNMMCQVNELLDTQNDIQCQQHHYHTQQSFIHDSGQQRSMMQQWKIFKATMTTGLTDDKMISSDEKTNYDSSYYPRVHYKQNIVQTTNSIIDDNTSIHMRALAFKYLGHGYDTTNLQGLNKLMSVIGSPINNGGNNQDTSINNIINNERYRNLLALKNTDEPSGFNYEGLKEHQQNILDIPVLKRQPKLL
ncbi:myb-like protein I isoform X2 [Microplitis mediator]|uniref:myb-like protein I isoform X2 n=1 Tax=Microplitis mediator TaxID=375433 RepID=UPI0025563566|nr:myb-like protein I isoform X2 [Microplitis mediator]